MEKHMDIESKACQGLAQSSIIILVTLHQSQQSEKVTDSSKAGVETLTL
jgi:hypothetical protein